MHRSEGRSMSSGQSWPPASESQITWSGLAQPIVAQSDNHKEYTIKYMYLLFSTRLQNWCTGTQRHMKLKVNRQTSIPQEFHNLTHNIMNITNTFSRGKCFVLLFSSLFLSSSVHLILYHNLFVFSFFFTIVWNRSSIEWNRHW